MMKTVKEIVKRERQKRRRRVGIMIVLIALCATAIFFGTKAYHNYKEEEFFKSVKGKEIKVTPKSITHKQTDIFTQSYQKETDDQLKALKKGKNYTFNKPLIVWNAYGTYTTSLYYYAKNDYIIYFCRVRNYFIYENDKSKAITGWKFKKQEAYNQK